jgi:hypothetical protein
VFLQVGEYLYRLAEKPVHPDDTVYVTDTSISLDPPVDEMSLYDFMEAAGLSEDPDLWDEAVTTLEDKGVWEV